MHNRPPLTAVFVDFDNVFARLGGPEAKAGQAFACQPETWLRWLTSLLEADGHPRRVAVRRCYVTATLRGEYRAAFLESGWEVIDCPTLTGAGKNGADIRIAVDMLELLDFKVPYDEFILLSADADFTPVLLHLRKRGCRTAVLAIGNSSAIYRASCDRIIDQAEFTRDALRVAAPPAKASVPLVVAKKTPALKTPVLTVPNPAPKIVTAPTAATPLERDRVLCLSRKVIAHVRAAPAPVHLPTIAKLLRDAEPSLDKDWGGHKTLTKFLNTLTLNSLVVSTTNGGHLYDPAIHAPPAKTPPQE